MPVYVETYQTVIQSTPMAEFSFDFAEGMQFLAVKRPKTLDVSRRRRISNKQKELNEFIKSIEGTDIIKFSSQYFSTGHNFV